MIDPRVAGLTGLILSRGTTPEVVAARLGVSQFMFARIDAGRQGLDPQVAARLAAIIGVDVADVRAVASRMIAGGPSTPWPLTMPPRLQYGDPLPHVLLHPIGPVPQPRRPQPRDRYLWISSPTNHEVSPSNAQRLWVVDRDRRELVADRDLHALSGGLFKYITALAYDGTYVWITGNYHGYSLARKGAPGKPVKAIYHSMLARIEARNPNGNIEFYAYDAITRNYLIQTGMSGIDFGSNIGLWKTNSRDSLSYPDGTMQLLNQADGTIAHEVSLTYPGVGGQTVFPYAAVNYDGYCYAYGVARPDDLQGRFHRIDPASLTRDRISTGHNLRTLEFIFAWVGAQVAVTTSGNGTLWVSESQLSSPSECVLYATDLGDFATEVISISEPIGGWAGGIGADVRGDIWTTGVDPNGGGIPIGSIAKVGQDGTVKALLMAAQIPNLVTGHVLAVDLDDDCVWITALFGSEKEGWGEGRVLRIDASTATVTDSVYLCDMLTDYRTTYDIILTQPT